ncbi:integrin alpha-X-like [Silurus asotus]|uniref:Integrin alpha-X-like n=1 Tax=Silurus asotus TaxID=30991 RepID=A0AAD5AHF6_SILAS|nr:integrin alpha-X-like [Silurus asotus]
MHFPKSETYIQSLCFFLQPQIGAYYGAELCVVDLDSNTLSDLLLVSAPLHNEGDQEGKVFVYTFMASQVIYIQVLKGIPGKRGRFGMTLASPADLNRDGKMDVVVGAPLEDNGQGSIYIFNGRNADIAPTHSQVRKKRMTTFYCHSDFIL